MTTPTKSTEPNVTTTRGVRITVRSFYDEKNSRPGNMLFIYTYTILIENKGKETVQLMNRHWIIRDAFGHVEEVRGAGVVGKQPLLQPGEFFEYSSSCPLRTPSGSMEGSFQMRDSLTQNFDAHIDRFELKAASLEN